VCVVPLNVTDQLVPEGSPVSVNVTAYGTGPVGEKVIISVAELPLTVTPPELRFAA
jgi:hypothetical protein